MPIESIVCPNCGAAVEFPAGATSTQCKYCNTTLRLKAEAETAPDAIELDSQPDPYRHLADMDQIKQMLRDGRRTEAIRLYMQQTGASLKEAQAAIDSAGIEAGVKTLPSNVGPYAVDLDRIQQLTRDGKKIEAIKLLRAQTYIGLKEAKDAVEAIERGELPTITIDQRRAASYAASSSGRFGCLVGCLPILLVIGACAGLIMLAGNLAFRAWGPYDQALALARADAKVSEAFGASFTPGAFIMGSISSSGSDSHAHFEVPIYGAQRSGMMYVSGSWHKGVWDISVTINYDEDGEEQSIYLSDQRK
jgi:LSD1 subclass zinc finger protein